MKSKKFIFLLFILLISGVIIFSISKPKTSLSPSLRLEAEKEIYTLLLDEELSNSTEGLPIGEYTNFEFLKEEYSNTNIPLFFTGFPVVKIEVYRDLEENNKKAYFIKDYLPESINTKIIACKSHCILFSRIGLDSSLTQALVVKERRIGCESDGVCYLEEGDLFFLIKVNDIWVIRKELFLWYQLTEKDV